VILLSGSRWVVVTSVNLTGLLVLSLRPLASRLVLKNFCNKSGIVNFGLVELCNFVTLVMKFGRCPGWKSGFGILSTKPNTNFFGGGGGGGVTAQGQDQNKISSHEEKYGYGQLYL
jgi:hypothetical protein